MRTVTDMGGANHPGIQPAWACVQELHFLAIFSHGSDKPIGMTVLGSLSVYNFGLKLNILESLGWTAMIFCTNNIKRKQTTFLPFSSDIIVGMVLALTTCYY